MLHRDHVSMRLVRTPSMREDKWAELNSQWEGAANEPIRGWAQPNQDVMM